jgi:hypothetical protein
MIPMYDPLQLLADTNWQIAKGYLQAVVAVQGARFGSPKYEALKDFIEGFVAQVEADELHL